MTGSFSNSDQISDSTVPTGRVECRMADHTPAIYFYVPDEERPFYSIAENVQSYWAWLMSQPGIRAYGKYNWTLQTFLHLRDANFPCHLTGELPSSGIVVAHRDFLGNDIHRVSERLLICILADRNAPNCLGRHPNADLHIVQNPTDIPSDRATAHADHYIPFWPQPGLLPRDVKRGGRFETVAYFGDTDNLAAELKNPTWAKRLAELGLRWQIVPRYGWHDYRHIDAIVAVRSFQAQTFAHKPATKLYNSWHAEVPAIFGNESAYRSMRQSELDYLEVNSFDEAISAVTRLRDSSELRQAMRANARLRSEETSPCKLIASWFTFFSDTAIPAYHRRVRLLPMRGLCTTSG